MASVSRKAAWHDRARRIYSQFPEVEEFDWARSLKDDELLFARVLRDMLKLEQAVPGRSGPRPSLDLDAATQRLQRVLGRDFTLNPFPRAYKALTKGFSVRQVAERTGLNRNVIHRITSGEMEPDPYHLQCIAEAFGKHPSYFLEWRILYICAAFARRLEWNPDSSVAVYLELDDQRRQTAKAG